MGLQDILTQLVQFVQEAAPAVWAIALKQVLVHTIQSVIGMVVCGGAVPLLWKCAKRQLELHEEDRHKMHDFGYGICVIGLSVSGILFLVFVLSVVGRLVNPDYYAIKLLLMYAQ